MSAKWFRRILNNSKPKNISNGGEKNSYFLIPASPQQIWTKKCSLNLSNVKLVPRLKFQTSRMSGTQSKTPLFTISMLDSWVIDGS